jgi:peptidoglycan/LPS O-acetylase OafA/YrhL
MGYHAGSSWMHAGFLGVDVFLVLSGFLITLLLTQEILRTGTVDRRAFWTRRARRLLPALFAVIIAVGVYAIFFATAAERSQIRGDALASLFYVQNWHLILQGQSYFAQFGTPSPLRPMWSLAIEEQWYIVWPLLFLFLWRVTRGRLARVAAITAGLALASAALMLAMYHAGQDPSRVYYGTDTRAQALLIGAVLAFVYAVRPRSIHAPYRLLTQVFGVLGLVYLAREVLVSTDQSVGLYRGGFTLVAVAAAALIAGAMTRGPLRSALSIKPLVLVGVISYGLYVWHWPLYLVLTPARTGLSGSALLVLRFAAAFAVATVSYVALERPIRRGKMHWVTRPTRWAPVGAVLVLTCVLVGTSTIFPAAGSASANALANLNTGTVSQLEKLGSAKDKPAPGATRVLIAGDSVAYTLMWEGLPKDLETKAWVQGAAIIGCGIEDGDGISQGIRMPQPAVCETRDAIYEKAVRRTQPQVSVLMIGAWDLYDRVVDGKPIRFGTHASELNFDRQFDRARSILTSTGAPLVLLTSPCFSPSDRALGQWGEEERAQPWRVDWLNTVIRRYSAAHPADTTVYDLHAILCPGGRYAGSIGGQQVRDDGIHFTKAGASYTYERLIPFLRGYASEHPVQRSG